MYTSLRLADAHVTMNKQIVIVTRTGLWESTTRRSLQACGLTSSTPVRVRQTLMRLRAARAVKRGHAALASPDCVSCCLKNACLAADHHARWVFWWLAAFARPSSFCLAPRGHEMQLGQD